MDRRDFMRALGVTGAFAAMPGMVNAAGLIVPKARGLKITGMFLDEISHDIPHQNWGEREWDADFEEVWKLYGKYPAFKGILGKKGGVSVYSAAGNLYNRYREYFGI